LPKNELIIATKTQLLPKDSIKEQYLLLPTITIVNAKKRKLQNGYP
jgi:hypothetical protein